MKSYYCHYFLKSEINLVLGPDMMYFHAFLLTVIPEASISSANTKKSSKVVNKDVHQLKRTGVTL